MATTGARSVTKREKPLGKTTPWAWVIEAVHGCNLRCGHCSCRLMEPGKYAFMTEATWRQSWEILQAVSPTVRVDIALAGEPTLHPHLVEFLRIARGIAPLAQIQITTNGTVLLKGTVTYSALLDAGANIVYTDMYGPREEFLRLAGEVDVLSYEYYNAPEGVPSPWTYQGPDLKMIVLQEQPENWPPSRYRAGLLGTWYNHLDWKAAAPFGLHPVEKAPARRCNQPFIYVPVSASGEYLLCCQDNWHETAGLLGSVHEGLKGFMRYWYGRELMTIRRRLRNKNREDTSYCSRCCITFSRCDYIYWKDNTLDEYWDGEQLKALPPQTETDPKWVAREARKKKGFRLL